MKIQHLHLTDLLSFRQCPRKFYWSKVKRIKSNNQRREIYFDEGSVGHLILKEFYTGENTSEQVKAYPEEIVGYMTELCNLYKNRYSEDKKNYEVLSCEQGSMMPWNGQVIEFTIDLKLLDRNTGTIVIFDHKFYSRKNVTLRSIYCDHQPWGYFIGLEYLKQPTNRFVLNVTYKRAIKEPKILVSGKPSTAKTTLDSCSYLSFVRVLDTLQLPHENYETELATLKETDKEGFSRFVIAPNIRRQDYVKGILNETTSHLDGITDEDNLEAFPMNFGYSCDKCAFFYLCQAQIEGGSLKDPLDFYYEEKDETER